MPIPPSLWSWYSNKKKSIREAVSGQRTTNVQGKIATVVWVYLNALQLQNWARIHQPSRLRVWEVVMQYLGVRCEGFQTI